MRDELLEIHRSFTITSVFVTHDQEEAMALSDKIAVMNAGKIEQFGAPAEITRRPRSRFVADFVGHKNILEGVISESGTEAATMQAGSLTMRVPRASAGTALASIPVHRLHVSRPPLAKTNCLEATVDHVSYLGPFIQIAVRIGDTVLESHQPSSRETEALRAGDAVHAAWDADDVVLIPAQRGPAMPRWRNRTPYLLCLPLLAFLAAFFLFPVGRMMLLSLTPQEAGGAFPTLRLPRPVRRAVYQNLTLRTLRVSVAAALLGLVMAFPVAI